MIKLLLCRLAAAVCILWFCAFCVDASCQAQEPGQNVWTSQNIGAPPTSGSTSSSGTTAFTLQGSGNYAGTADTGRFCYQPLAGDGSLVAKVSSITGPNGALAGGGVMIRASTGTGSQVAYMEATSGSNKYYLIRTATGTAMTSTSVSPVTIPYWVKVVRSGASFSGYISSNGSTWTQVGSTTSMSLPDTVDIGLAASSSGSTSLTTVAFTNVSLTQSNSLGIGVGLYAEYFNAGNLTRRAFTRFDPSINFPAGTWSSTPAPAITSSTFSARWTGTIVPRYSGTYTFNTTFNGGIRVWIYPLPVPAAGETTAPIVDSWSGSANGNVSVPVPMTVGTTYRIEVDYTSAGQSSPGVTLSWSSVNQTSEIVPMQQLFPAYAGKGRVLDEKWLGMSGSSVSNLTGMANYPNHPAGRHFLTALDIGNNVGGNAYGDQMSGYIYPPETGNYTFYIAGMDEAQLWLSPSETATNTREICDVPAGGSTGYLQWNAYPSQTSTNIYLYASQRYYFKVLHAGAQSGGDNCAVGWTTPSGIVEKPIPAERVCPYEAVTTIPTQSAMFNTLATGHPRLFTDAQGFANLKALALTTSPTPTQQNLWYVGLGGTAATTTSLGNPVSGSLLYAANALFAQPPTAATETTGGTGGTGSPSYLVAIRQIEGRVILLSMAYQLSGNPDYLNRAWEELDCAGGVTVTPNTALGDTWTGSVTAWANWTTWGVNDLCYAEILNSFAIGYDWLYNGLTTAQTSFLEASIMYAMTIQLGYYEAGPTAQYSGVVYFGPGNHTDVDFGSTCTGALAVANDPSTSSSDTNTCAETLSYSMTSTTYGCFTVLAPDGCDPESPDYDMYLTSFLGYGLASLEAANAGDMGLAQQPGQAKLGGYELGVSSPNLTSGIPSMYNYNDCWDVLDLQWAPAEFWYGWKFDQSMDAWSEISTTNLDGAGGPSPFDLLWYDSRGSGQNSNVASSPLNAGMPLDTMYRNSDIMTFRTSNSSPSDAYGFWAAIKGGDNTAGHGHLSQGSFMFHCYGYEWASLLGFDSYGLNEYFCCNPTYNPDRWEYYRCRAEGSNTLVIGPPPSETGAPDQTPGYTGSNSNPNSVANSSAQSKVIQFTSTPTIGETILNMTALYPNAAQTLRGLQLNRPAGGKPYMLVQDEVTTTGSTSIYWFMHYCYEVDSTWIHNTVQTGSTSTLETTGGKTIFLKILSPPGAFFYDTTATPLATSPNPSGQNPNNLTSYYWRKLAIHITATSAGTTTICVEAYPGGDPGSYPAVIPLSTWASAAAAAATPSPTPTPTPTPTPAPTPTLSIGMPSTSGTLQLTINGSVGHPYEIQASIDLVTWTTVYSTSNPTIPFTWADPSYGSYAARFYRVIQDP